MSLFGKKSTLAPLLQAAKDGKAQDVRAQIQQGADLNQADAEKGNTALLFAAENGKTEAAEVLIEAKANVNLANKKGTTALMYAALAGNLELVQALLAASADTKAKDANGQTALVLARVKAQAQGMYADEQLVKVRDLLATLPA